MWRRSAVISGIAMLTLVGVGASASPYVLADLGPISPDTVSLGYALNTVGGKLTVVGQTGAAGTTTPVSWTISGNVATPAALGGGTLAGLSAFGIDSSGSIVGGKSAAASGVRAYYLPNGGSPFNLEPMSTSGLNCSIALGISDGGYVAGQASSADSTNNLHATVWSKPWGSWTATDLGGLDPNAQSSALAVNNTGVIAGWSYTGSGTSGNQEAVAWTPNGSSWTIRDLDPTHVLHSNTNAAYGINSAGDIVGAGYYQGAIWSTPILFKHDGTIVSLGNFSMDGVARGINSGGTVVGYAYNGSNYHAFVSNGTANSLQDLNSTTQVPGLGTWLLYQAMAIDDQGNIVGRGYPTGTFTGAHAWLLRPAMAGDANADGTVNITDLNKALTNYDKTGLNWQDGDFDGNGTVNVTDLNKVLTNYDHGLASVATNGGATAVPEPSSMMLLTIGLFGILGFACRRSDA